MNIVNKLKEMRKALKLETATEFSRLLNNQHRFDFVDELEWDIAEGNEDYDRLEELSDDCITIQVTGSMNDYYAKLLCVDSKGGLYIAQEDDLKIQNWVHFSRVHGSYYEIAILEEMTNKLK
jgi:hypothetical protein